MAKKKREAPRLSEAQLYRPMQNVVVEAAAEDISEDVALEVVLAEEYQYVIQDLKKIGWLALAMLALLIVLSLVIV
ncbi:MAG: hypothetical protein ACLFTI_13425 [Anaerolineales bacterium]